MNLKELQLTANHIRKNIILMLSKAGTGHSAGALGLADIFTYLYFAELKHNPKKPKDPKRDFLILSNGHICPVLYATLAKAGYFKESELLSLRKLGSRLQGHPNNHELPGIENSSGPLGQGISQAIGLAAALKRDNKKNRVFCIIGDGEMQEGQVWEALMFATKEKLDNLFIIIDRNHIQIDGYTEIVCSLEPLSRKLTAFGYAAIEFDGNNIIQFKHTLAHAKKIKHKPVCLIARTTPGKGVSFMEGKYSWHGKAPNEKEALQALRELNYLEHKIKGGEN